MDLSEKMEYAAQTIATQNQTIAALEAANKDLAAQRDMLLAELVDSATITEQDADAIKAVKDEG